LPQVVGTCTFTSVAKLERRSQEGPNGPPVPGSGSAVVFADSGHQVSYDELDAIDRSRVGDRVMLCLVSIPRHCPPGDPRRRIDTTTYLRTLESWTLPDAEHACAGA
jgi:hypothetical protein